MMSLNDYKAQRFADAWKLAQEQIKQSQTFQKLHYDASANEPNICEGDRVYIYTLAEKSGAPYKFAHPFIGPYQVLKQYDTGVDIFLASKPFLKPIQVALSRVRMCPVEILEEPQQQANLEEIEGQVESVNSKDTEEDVGEQNQLRKVMQSWKMTLNRLWQNMALMSVKEELSRGCRHCKDRDMQCNYNEI